MSVQAEMLLSQGGISMTSRVLFSNLLDRNHACQRFSVQETLSSVN
jgi:hypothetical protein